MTSVVAALTWKYGPVFDTAADRITAWRHPTDPKPNQAQIDQVVIDYGLDATVIETNQDNAAADTVLAGFEGRLFFAIATLVEVDRALYAKLRILDPGWDLPPDLKRRGMKLFNALSA